MATTQELVVTLSGGRRVDVRVGDHVVHTDQPTDKGGGNSAPSPFELFLASMGACAGIYVQGFCAARGIAFEGVRILEHPRYDAEGALRSVDLELQLPPDFPEKYRDAVVKVAEQCSVKRAIHAQPTLTVRVAQREDAAALSPS